MSSPPFAAQGLHPAALARPDPEAPAPRGLRFGEVPITETGAFPPPAAPHCWVYVTLNAEIALSLPHSAWLRRLVQEPRARVSIDGQWLWWALRRKYPQQPLAKLAGSDLIHRLAGHALREGLRLLLVGTTPEVNGQAVMRLRQQWPGLEVAGYAPAQYAIGTQDETRAAAETLAAIEAWRADCVVLGLGAAKEHRLAERIAPLLDGRVQGLCCFGGAIDMASGRLRRAPVWMQRCGLEALFRLCQRPSRWRRCLSATRILLTIAAARY